MSLPKNYDDLPMNWVGDLSGRKAKISPNFNAVYDVATNTHYTYKQIDDRANKVAVYLRDVLNIERGDRICILMTNRLEAVDLFFACSKLGCILSPLSYFLHKNELEDLMNRIQPKVIIFEDKFADLIDSWTMPEAMVQKICIGDSEKFYEEEVLSSPLEEVNIPLSLNYTQMYIHTGGTTAVPKVCIVPYRQMVWNAVEILMTVTMVGAGMDQKILQTFPFFHIGGWNALFCTFYMGGEAVLIRGFDADLVLDLIDRGDVNSFGAVEAMLQFMVASPKFAETDFSSVVGVTTAAAPCTEAALKPFWDKGVRTNQAYGLTEAGPSNFMYILQTGTPEEVKANAGKIGHPMMHCDYKIVDKDTKEQVKQGEEGVLCMRSPHSFGGYLNDHWRTEKLFLDGGWIYTGDMAVEDEKGLVSIVGRSDNMFISGGENVSPEEIEQVLKCHPAVAGAICVGVKDQKWGEAPVALVVLRVGHSATGEEIKEFCQSQLAKFKIPKEIRIGEALPLTGAGKLDRNTLRSMFI